DLDVVVDVHLRGGPLAVDEALGRKRPQGRLVEALKERAPAHPVARITRSLRSSSSSAMRSLSASSEKKVWLRSLARIQRWTTRAPASTLALSRGWAGRAGTIAVP